jgi:hypothetical protein
MGTKICTKCGAEKTIDLFGIHRQAPDGHMTECYNWTNQRPLYKKDNISKSSWYNGGKYYYKKTA